MQLRANIKLAVSSFHSLCRRVLAGMEGERNRRIADPALDLHYRN